MAASVSDAANLDGEGLDGGDCAGSGAFSWETVRNLSDALCMGDLDLSDPNARLNTVFQYNASALIEVSQTRTTGLAGHEKNAARASATFCLNHP
jgi:hypothetical protein